MTNFIKAVVRRPYFNDSYEMDDEVLIAGFAYGTDPVYGSQNRYQTLLAIVVTDNGRFEEIPTFYLKLKK